MHRVFNCGIGMAVVVAAEHAGARCALNAAGEARRAHRRHRAATGRRARHGRRLTR
jgi:phosphoribosylaminoimidazole (AIR) synthetase